MIKALARLQSIPTQAAYKDTDESKKYNAGKDSFQVSMSLVIKKTLPDVNFARGTANKRGMVAMSGALVPTDKIKALLKDCKASGLKVEKKGDQTIVTADDAGNWKTAGFIIRTKGDTSTLHWFAYE